VEATIDTISTEGLDGVTIWKVTKNANLSRGMCTYHVETKEHLIVEVFQMVHHEHETTWRRILHAIAVSLTGMIDGLGRQYVISPGQLTSQEAIGSCRAYFSNR
jgi:DNA-binding transcriptional regulator YbjK